MSKIASETLKRNARQFTSGLKKLGFSLATGVPCSLLKTLIEYLETSRDFRYVPNVKEDAALGLATGAYLAGQKACVLMQNSGFGYSLNVLTSLNLIYKIPLLILMSYRGYQGIDAPEHIVMGAKIEKLLAELEIPVLIPSENDLEEKLLEANNLLERNKIPVVLLIREGLFG